MGFGVLVLSPWSAELGSEDLCLGRASSPVVGVVLAKLMAATPEKSKKACRAREPPSVNGESLPQ